MIGPHAVTAELVAVLVAVTSRVPRVLVHAPDGDRAPAMLPSGPFEGGERSLQVSLRDWLARRTGQSPLYLEQLYTFADRDRVRPSPGADGGLGRVISVSYLALAREGEGVPAPNTGWRDWYAFFPWEDRRRDARDAERARDALRGWAGRDAARQGRVALAFGDDGVWDEDLALARYELLHEAGLVAEAGGAEAATGLRMARDHRRILATAIARLRAKIKYRALVFELMPPTFTLLELQHCMEAIAGRMLHKGNFRRLIAAQDLIEETGEEKRALGRPARLYRFRGALLAERALATTRLPVARS